MESIKAVWLQLKGVWDNAGRQGRIGFVTASVLAIASIVGVGIWSSTPDYVAIASNLAPEDTAEIVSKLDTDGIAYKLDSTGSSVLVPKNKWNRARLALGNLVDPNATMPDEVRSSPFESPSDIFARRLRQKEIALAKSIQHLAAVQQATVHISQGEPSPFIDKESPTTASVVIALAPGVTFGREKANSIVSLVASSVEGLDPSEVTVVDTSGRLLSSYTTATEADIESQLAYQRQVESDLAAKAELMLSEALGPGHAVVRVTANIDFTRTERQGTIFEGDPVKLTETIDSSTTNAVNSSPSGPAGTASNATSAASGNSSKPVVEKRETIDATYEHAKETSTVTVAPGKINRLTVAVMVDLTADEDAEETAKPSITKEDVEAIVKNAVGFEESRSDGISVVVTKLAGQTDLALGAGGVQPWQQAIQIARSVSLGVASTVVLVLFVLISRKMKPLKIADEPTGMTMTADQARHLAQLSSQVQQHPEEVANIVKSWLGETETVGDETESAEAPRIAA